VAAAQREVATRVTASLTDQFDTPETMDFITRFMPKPEPAAPRQDRDPDRDLDDAGGTVLRKRQGRPTQDPQRPRPDDGGPLLR
jgi:hypothetical protein